MKRTMRFSAWLFACVFLMAGSAAAQKEEKDNVAGPYVPTPWPIVDELLKLAEIGSGDMVYDLGSGDGRLVITAAKRYGARGMGIELDPKLVALATAGAQKEGVGGRVKFVQGDLFESSFRDASVVTLYLLPRFVTRLVPKFRDELRPGTRIVSHDYPLSPWPPDKTLSFEVDEKEPITGSKRTILYYYVVPAKVAGTWEVTLPRTLGDRPITMELQQDVETTAGVAHAPNGTITVRDPSVRGERVRFALLLRGRVATFTGTVSDKTINGDVSISGEKAPERWSARLLRSVPSQ
jgi:SAM-dependent methyltransferase